jgi:hypothetical protein
LNPRSLVVVAGLLVSVVGCRDGSPPGIASRCAAEPSASGAIAASIVNADEVSRYLLRQLRSEGITPEDRVEGGVYLLLDSRGTPMCYRIERSLGSDRVDALAAAAAMRARFSVTPSPREDANTWVVLPIVLQRPSV